MKTDIILTIDYEIHGNGQGKFEDFCYRPTKYMLKLANIYNIKLSFMVEMEHYFAMTKYPNTFDSEIKMFNEQIREIILLGHDIQLHLHPQWLKAELVNAKWIFPYTSKEIALLTSDYFLAYERISKAKSFLDSELRKINNGYKCIGFRAGFFQMQPSNNITRALIDNGILCDSSVVKGMNRNNDIGLIDYRKLTNGNSPYLCDINDIVVENKNSKLMEMPIFTIKENSLLNKIKKTIFPNNTCQTISKNQRNKVNFSFKTKTKKGRKVFRKRNFFKYRYVDFLMDDVDNMIISIKKSIIFRKTDPIVLIGHSKDFLYSNNLRKLFEFIDSNHNLKSLTLQQGIEKNYENLTCFKK